MIVKLARACVVMGLLAVTAMACGSDDEKKSDYWCCQVREICLACFCSGEEQQLGQNGNEQACQQYAADNFCGNSDEAAIINKCAAANP